MWTRRKINEWVMKNEFRTSQITVVRKCTKIWVSCICHHMKNLLRRLCTKIWYLPYLVQKIIIVKRITLSDITRYLLWIGRLFRYNKLKHTDKIYSICSIAMRFNEPTSYNIYTITLYSCSFAVRHEWNLMNIIFSI